MLLLLALLSQWLMPFGSVETEQHLMQQHKMHIHQKQ
jgi:hypothetical protein